MRLFNFLTIIFLLSCLFSLRCAKLTVLRTQELERIGQEVKDHNSIEIRETEKYLNEKINLLDKKITVLNQEQMDFLRRMYADNSSLFEELDLRIKLVEGKIDENQYNLLKIRKASSMVKKKKHPDEMTSDSLPADQTGSLSSSDTMESFINVEKLYNLAYSDFINRRYDLALNGFQEFLKNFPDMDLSDNAQYWIGEYFYVNKNYAQAITEYKKVIKNYSQGNKVSTSLLKMAMSYKNLNKKSNALKYLKNVINRFPGSDDSKIADQYLKKWSQ